MQKDIGGNHSLVIPNTNLSDKKKDLINQTKFMFNNDQFISFTSYNNYNFTTTVYSEEEEEEKEKEKYKSLSFNLSYIFSFDKLDSFDNGIDGDDISSKENIYFIKNQKINKEKEKIFLIKKGKRKRENRKRGRLEKNTIPSYKLKHNKFSRDDIIQKIKRHFINRLLRYINEIYKDFKKKQNVKKKIKPLLISISPEKYNFYNNKKNIEFFNNTIEDLFSAEISIRNCNFLRKHSSDSNKKRIVFLKKENKAKEVINILNSTVKEMYGKYTNNELNEFCLEDDLIEVEKKDGTDYKNLYKEIAQELIYHLNKKQEKFENE